MDWQRYNHIGILTSLKRVPVLPELLIFSEDIFTNLIPNERDKERRHQSGSIRLV
jgi:hypothetical protein